eukprot:symbB.v1.2.026579.t1/scaffold2582.1/size75767/1
MCGKLWGSRLLEEAQSKLVSGDIKVLKVLPRHLRDSLLEEVSLPVLILHPLFNYLSTKSYDEMVPQLGAVHD